MDFDSTVAGWPRSPSGCTGMTATVSVVTLRTASCAGGRLGGGRRCPRGRQSSRTASLGSSGTTSPGPSLWKEPKLNQAEPGIRIRFHIRGTHRIHPWPQFHPQMVLWLQLVTWPTRVEQHHWSRHVPMLLRLPGGICERGINAAEKLLLRFGGAPPHEQAMFREEGRRGGVITEDQGLPLSDRHQAGVPIDATGSVVVGFRPVAVCARPRRQDCFGHNDQRPATGLHPLDRTWICIPRHARKLQAAGDNDHGQGTSWHRQA